MMLDRKQIQVNLLFKFKIGFRAAGTTSNINKTIGPRTASEHTMQWCWFKKFCKGEERLGGEECSGQPLEVDNAQLTAIIEDDPLPHGKLLKNSMSTILQVIWHLKQMRKMKQLDKWVLHELTTNQQNRPFEVLSSLILHNNNAPFPYQTVMCKDKCILCNRQWWPSQWLDQEETPKHLPKPNLHQKKKVMVTVWLSIANLIHYSFLNPGENITSEKHAQQIDEMYQKLQHLQQTLVKKKGPTLLHGNAQPHITQPMLQKLKELGYKVLPHLPYSPDLLPTDYHFKHLDNFLQRKCFHNQQEAENAFQEFNESWSMNFYAIGINKLISHCQKFVDYNGSYFD